MSLFNDFLQIETLSQIRELRYETSDSLNRIADIQQNMYNDLQNQKYLKNYAFKIEKQFENIKTKNRDFVSYCSIYYFMEHLSLDNITEEDFVEINDKEYYSNILNEISTYAYEFISSIPNDLYAKYKNGISAMEESYILDKIVENEELIESLHRCEKEEIKRLNGLNKIFGKSLLKTLAISFILSGIGLFFNFILPKLVSEIKYVEYLPYACTFFCGLGILIFIISFLLNIPKHTQKYYKDYNSIKRKIDIELIKSKEKLYGDELIKIDDKYKYLEKKSENLHNLIKDVDGEEIYQYLCENIY